MQPAHPTLADLGYPNVLRALAERCRTELGRDRAFERPFLDGAEAVRNALGTVEEARVLAERQLTLPLDGDRELRHTLERAEKRALLEPRELLSVARFLEACGRAKEILDENETLVPRLHGIGRNLPALGSVAAHIQGTFEPSGEIADRASPELRSARERTRGLHRTIKSRLEDLLHSERFAQNLRETYYSVRNDRYVVPVLASHQAEVPGIVHNASQSGQTLFVEPQTLIGLGNELAIAQSLVLEEERRILQALSDEVARHAERIATGLAAVAELDELQAAARLSVDLGAVSPEVTHPDGALELTQLRHPLLSLAGTAVVPNDVRMVGETRTLVLSGPNAGGKTVTLTGIGLCALMTRAGLPIPVAPGSKVPLFQALHAAVGDAQDLAKGLSTFSAHIARLREIDVDIGRGSLVLIDEIAAGTDPREGAALAIALLESWLDRGVRAVVTTHLDELKALANVDLRFQNARVGFDAVKMAPTYRLQLGVAGESSAIDIAARTGLPAAICDRARTLAIQAGGPLPQALAAAEAERRRLAVELERVDASRKAAEEERDRLAEERRKLAAERANQTQQHHERLKGEYEKVAEELRELLTELRAKPTIRAASEARGQALDAAEKAERAAEAAREEAQPSAPEPEVPLAVGGWARYRRLKQKVEILELSAAEALVASGAMKIRVPISELSGIPSQKTAFPGGGSKAERARERAERAAAAELRAPGATCDVRGLRAEEALRELERFLDRAMRQGDEEVVVIHGHGTGALKQGIRQYLERSPYVRLYRPGQDHEGGDGVTVVALRG